MHTLLRLHQKRIVVEHRYCSLVWPSHDSYIHMIVLKTSVACIMISRIINYRLEVRASINVEAVDQNSDYFSKNVVCMNKASKNMCFWLKMCVLWRKQIRNRTTFSIWSSRKLSMHTWPVSSVCIIHHHHKPEGGVRDVYRSGTCVMADSCVSVQPTAAFNNGQFWSILDFQTFSYLLHTMQ